MDDAMYSNKTIDTFIKSKLCQDDALLYKYYQEVDVKKFRSRLSKFRDIDDDIKSGIQTFITDATRDVILGIIRELADHMKSYGDLIISGGDAVNAYIDKDYRIVTTDIDTKFTPVVKLSNSTLITSSSPQMFGYIQIAKLVMWDKLGQIVTRFSKLICKRIQKLIIDGSPLGKLFGISFGTPPVNRRYTLIKKSKESSVLIDIELFAIDLQLRYYIPSEKKIKKQNIGGLLDIAYMRPNEFGFEATFTKSKGIYITNPITKKIVYDKKIQVASEKFLIEDIYALQKYNLRPTKKKKDQQRMYTICKYVLNMNVKSSDSLESMYKKAIKKVGVIHTSLMNRPILTKAKLATAMRISPYKYESITTKPSKERVYKQLFYGLKGTNNLSIPGYSPTYSNYRFSVNKGEWIKNNSPLYIHNESTYRPNNIKNIKFVPPPLKDLLYGYSPARNAWMPPKLVQKAATITLVGLNIKVVNSLKVQHS
jgi:hypothetical protein